MSCGFVPFFLSSSSDTSASRDVVSSVRVQNASLSPLVALSHIFVIAVLPPSLRSAENSGQAWSSALVSTCFLSGDHSVEVRLSISMWNASVCSSVSLCDTDSDWLSDAASALRLFDERVAHAFAFKRAIHAVMNSSQSSISKDAAVQFLEQTSASCLLQLSRPANSDRLVFTSPHGSISAASLVDAVSSELQSRFPVRVSKDTFASKMDDTHVGVIFVTHSGDLITVHTVVLPEQDSNESNDLSVGDIPSDLAKLLSPDEGDKSPVVVDVSSAVIKDWVRNVLSACVRKL
jgi:hypothetical protein